MYKIFLLFFINFYFYNESMIVQFIFNIFYNKNKQDKKSNG